MAFPLFSASWSRAGAQSRFTASPAPERHSRSTFPAPTGRRRPRRPAKAEPTRGGAETILLVDDAGSLRGLIRRLLEDGGYTVLDSGDPAVALCIAQEHPGPISLLITDVVLPGFSGSDLAARVTKARPETKVLYVSGFNDDSVAPSLLPGHSYAFLKKPFTQDDLLRKVRQLLDSSMKTLVRPRYRLRSLSRSRQPIRSGRQGCALRTAGF